VDLKDCVHWVDQEDKIAVEKALRDRNMNGKKHSEDEIEEPQQRDNVKWKRFSNYQRKWVKPFPTIVAELNQLWVKSKTNASEGVHHHCSSHYVSRSIASSGIQICSLESKKYYLSIISYITRRVATRKHVIYSWRMDYSSNTKKHYLSGVVH
jgi:hypothetical protein